MNLKIFRMTTVIGFFRGKHYEKDNQYCFSFAFDVFLVVFKLRVKGGGDNNLSRQQLLRR